MTEIKPYLFIIVPIAIAIVIMLILASIAVVILLNNQEKDDTEEMENIGIDFITSTSIPVTSGSVDDDGGSISIEDGGSNLNGLRIDVPQDAVTDPVNFNISYAEVTDVMGLPGNASIAGPMIIINTDGDPIWNKYRTFDKPTKVTLPYDPNLLNSNETVRYYTYDEEENILSSAGFIGHDENVHTISFYTRTFSKFIAIKLSLKDSEYFGKDFTIDTGFRPKIDGFYIRNYGSYLESGGHCVGMVSYARYYYMCRKDIDGTGLYEKYREGDREEWRDDATAIQIATRAHMAEASIWKQFYYKEIIEQIPSSDDVALSWIHGMAVTGSPQLIGIYQQIQNGNWTGAHAIMTYKYSNGRFDIYDPNFPGTEPGTGARQIPFTSDLGIYKIYNSGTSAGSGAYRYNIFVHFGYKVFHPMEAFHQLYESGEKKFDDGSIFPKIELTDLNTFGTTPTDTDGDMVRDTPSLTASISGKITGGAKKVKSTLIFISNQKFKVPVDEFGLFIETVPLYTGENDLVILATDENTFDNWSGYLKETIECHSSKSAFILTLTWEPGNSNLNLHVMEPTIDGYLGRQMYPHGGQGAT